MILNQSLFLLPQGIMKTLDHMKLDMANFHIQQARPLIVDQSVDYEKKKFKEFLAIQVCNFFEMLLDSPFLSSPLSISMPGSSALRFCDFAEILILIF